MPQDKRRSISYRSFVTCDDPKGIECGAIRKSKINSQINEQKITSKVELEPVRKQGNSNQNTSVTVSVDKEKRDKKEMIIRGITRGIETTPVTFQLLEVSKETDKLNHVINFWSDGTNFKEGNENRNVAKDLLKGAIDVHESLAMLGKLQDASSFMLGFSRKEKQKVLEGTFDGMVSGVRGFERSHGRYSRKSCDEMRSVVRDSLLRQNLMITNPVFEEHMGSPDMMPSTSSSQSSMVYSSNFVPSDSSISSSTNSEKRKGKHTNLIVRLMGLESFPSSPRRHAEKERILNLVKPVYDNDSPRAKRPQFGALEVSMMQRSVEEILENLKSKGVLRNSSVNGLTSNLQESEVFCPKNSSVNGLTINSQESEVFCLKNSPVNERPPIVVMKPIRYPCLDLDGPYVPKFWGENVMKPRHIRGSAQETVRNETVNVIEKPEVRKGFYSEEKAESNKKATYSKVKGSVNSQPKLQKKQAEVKKASEVEKVTRTRRKGEEKKDAKSSDLLKSRDQEKCTTLKTKRQNKDGKSISKNQASNQQKMAPITVSDNRKRGNSEPKKNRQPQPVLVVEEKRVCKAGKKECGLRGDCNSVFPTVNSIISDGDDKEKGQIPIRDYDLDSRTNLSDYLPSDKKISQYDDNQSYYSEITSVSTSEHCSVDQLGETQSLLREVTLITTHENGIAVHHSTNQEQPKSLKSSIYSSRTKVTPKTKLKSLLLSNSSWLNSIEKLFNIQVNPDSVPCLINNNDEELESSRLLIDCGKEISELKSLQLIQACLPLPTMYTNSSVSHSLDWMLEEVSSAIEDLRCYSRPIGNEFCSDNDNLYVLMDRDLRFMSRIWGVGWRKMYTQDEVEQVIGEIDRFVLSKLIDEVLLDLIR